MKQLKKRNCQKFYEKQGNNMKPQSRLPSGTLRKPLCTQKEYSLVDITKYIRCDATGVYTTFGLAEYKRMLG